MRRAQRKPSTSREKFGTLLRTHRNRLGISMIAFARAIGMDQGLLSRIERGQRPAPQIVPFVHRMALKLGFEKDSKYYKELIEAAYVSRFGTKRPAMSSGESAYHVMDVPPGSSGLAGLARQGPMVPWGIKHWPLTGPGSMAPGSEPKLPLQKLTPAEEATALLDILLSHRDLSGEISINRTNDGAVGTFRSPSGTDFVIALTPASNPALAVPSTATPKDDVSKESLERLVKSCGMQMVRLELTEGGGAGEFRDPSGAEYTFTLFRKTTTENK